MATLRTGDKFSLIQFYDRLIRIDRIRKIFKKDLYTITDAKDGLLLGSFDFLDNDHECILSLTEGSTYFFHRNKFSYKVLQPGNWFSFKHELTDSTDVITFSGRFSFRNNIIGTVESTNAELFLPIMAGLFIKEENLRRSQENSG